MVDQGFGRSASSTRTYRRLRYLSLMIAMVLAAVGVADAKITFRPARPPNSPYNNFYFHAQYGPLTNPTPFDPATALGIRVYNCADGTEPTAFHDGVQYNVYCSYPTLARLVFEVQVPANACVKKKPTSNSCSFRDRTVGQRQQPGLRSFRVKFPIGTSRNKVWLDFYGGDFSLVDQAKMLLVITIDGTPRNSLFDTFTPLRNGGWWSKF